MGPEDHPSFPRQSATPSAVEKDVSMVTFQPQGQCIRVISGAGLESPQSQILLVMLRQG